MTAKKENSVVSGFLGFVKDKGCDSFEMHRQIAVPEHTEAGNTPGQRALSLSVSQCVCVVCLFCFQQTSIYLALVPGILMQACYPATWKDDAGELRVQGQPRTQSEFQTSAPR